MVENSTLGLGKYLKEWKDREKNWNKIKELSTESKPFMEPNKTCFRKSRPRKLERLLNDICSTDMDNFFNSVEYTYTICRVQKYTQ